MIRGATGGVPGVSVLELRNSIRRLAAAAGWTNLEFETARGCESFSATVMIDGLARAIRISAARREPPIHYGCNRHGTSATTPAWRARFAEQERRRVWRGLYRCLGGIFERMNSGAAEPREIRMKRSNT